MNAASTPNIAVVGGGTGILGQAVVARLHAAGWRVVVPARHPGGVPAPDGVTTVACDLDDAPSVERFAAQVDRMGRWAALVNASGGYADGPAHEADDTAILAQLQLNLLGPWRLARAAARSMIASGAGGRIVNVASKAAVDVVKGQAAYQVSKAGLLRLTEVMAAELHGHSISVNAVLPQVIDTPSNRRAMPDADLSRWISPDEVAAVIEWLLSGSAGVVSGAAVPVYQR